MTSAAVPAKINLALVVGATQASGLHELASVMQRIDIADRLTIEPAADTAVFGLDGDTLIRQALESLSAAAGVRTGFHATIEKHIPVAAGLGGGSADAAAALSLANALLDRPVSVDVLHELAVELGSDVPFFLDPGPKLVEGTGQRLRALDLPQDFYVVLLRPDAISKRATGDVYRQFDALGGGTDFGRRRDELLDAIGHCHRARDLAFLPTNDLAEASGASGHVEKFQRLGAFRSDVSGAGPCVYGLFTTRPPAECAAAELGVIGTVWLTVPVW